MRAVGRSVIILFILLLFASDAFAIGSNGRNRMRLKFTGDCDAMINNLRSAPEQVAAISDGTDCTATVILFKKKKSGRNKRLRNKSVSLYYDLERAGEPQLFGSATTNKRGRATIDFSWDANICRYWTSHRTGTSKELSETLIRLESDRPDACNRAPV